MVDPRRSLPDVCDAVLAARFAAVDEIGVPRCFVMPIIKPFVQIVANILEHTSIKWFCHRCSGTRDIIIFVPLFLLFGQIAALSGLAFPANPLSKSSIP
jgi:hypothetical protein